ncbi:hypothetical protein [Vibrio cholerae]|uniref:hypothetical protein n=4 Tax=Vibrio cholerae TaxID=666 RepID=UPI00028EE65F|nr:hypothetical protein [Vibrio cholerae]EKG54518.1 hypothetical protein VCHC50A1_0279 [Vibrio cholerae HC-50A1]EKG59732.1 hypothetical protein VCHC52A1_0280 [Vibrio cholerae HC-52A1]EKG65218.1 hypothetical protein VCHC55A1_0282 [Vibrio cholerae HC-55A1]EKG74272.1 hypothetical protein VCHC57A1_0279 [Vibrio cholerae HC-57A1]EKG94382.1 hypothetical protein VCHC51A1_0278 [Vibrio cholerae HC-51A1]
MKVESHFLKFKSGKESIKHSTELLTPSRFDIFFKLLYLDMLEMGDPRAEDIYDKHIYIITEGTVKEKGNQRKNSYDVFRKDFLSIYESIKDSGFCSEESIVPVGHDGSILDGAHRVASAIKSNAEVLTIELEAECKNYDYQYFIDNGMPDQYCSLALRNGLRYIKDINLACIWQGDVLLDLLSDNSDVYFVKSISSTYTSVKNLVVEFYSGESWIGDLSNSFSGADGKVIPCLSNDKNIHLVWFKSNLNLLELKDHLRKKVGVGKHSIHITDNFEQCMVHSRFLLSQAFDLLVNNFSYNKSICVDYLNKLKNEDIPSSAIISGSAILALSNKRKSSDVDYFYDENVDGKLDVSTHNSLAEYLPYNKDLMFGNDLLTFDFLGIKFLDLWSIIEFKKNRNEEKDIIDIKLIYSNKRKLADAIKGCWVFFKIKIKHKLINFLTMVDLIDIAIALKRKVMR